MSLHSKQPKMHPLENWSFANTTTRIANGTYSISDDLGKIAYQQDDGSYWRLTNVAGSSPAATPTWQAVGSSATNDPRRLLVLYLVTGLTGGGSTKLDGQASTNLTFGQKVVVTLNDADAFYTYQNGSPNTALGDVALLDNTSVRWRKTSGY